VKEIFALSPTLLGAPAKILGAPDNYVNILVNCAFYRFCQWMFHLFLRWQWGTTHSSLRIKYIAPINYELWIWELHWAIMIAQWAIVSVSLRANILLSYQLNQFIFFNSTTKTGLREKLDSRYLTEHISNPSVDIWIIW